MSDGSKQDRNGMLRDAVAARDDLAAPPGMVKQRHPAPRGVAHPEEEADQRGEWWTLVKAVAIVAGFIMLIGWLISA